MQKNHPKNAPFWLHFCSILAPFWLHLGDVGLHIGFILAPFGLLGGVLGGILFFAQFWLDFEPHWASILAPFLVQNRYFFRWKNALIFWLIFEPISALFWEPFWSKFASKIMPEQRNPTLRFYREFSSGSRVRAFKAHPKINEKSIEKSTTFLIEKSNENWSKMIPKIPPKTIKNVTKNHTEKIAKKITKNDTQINLWLHRTGSAVSWMPLGSAGLRRFP